MRKTLFRIGLLLLPLMGHGQPGDVKKKKYNLILGTFNDSWGGGFTQIKDDYRSFGFDARLEQENRFALEWRYSGLTDKGLTGSVKGSRTDELRLKGQVLGLPMAFGFLDIHAVGGVYILNDLGGETLQNATHSLFGVSEVKVPYADLHEVNYLLGLNFVSAPLILKKFNHASLQVHPSAEAFIAFNYMAGFTPQCPLTYKSDKGMEMSLAPGYQLTKVLSTGHLLKTVNEIETGPTLEYRLKAGLLFLQWKTYFNGRYSVGTYGINLPINSGINTFQKNDFSVEIGNMNGGAAYYGKYLWNKTRLAPRHLKFAYFKQYGSYLRAKLFNYPRVYGHYRQLCLGLEYSPLKDPINLFIHPFASLYLGYKHEFLYAGTEAYSSQTARSAIAFGQVGVKLTFPRQFLYKASQYGFSLHYNYLHVFSRSNNEVFGRQYRLPLSMSYFGGGIYVNLDL